MWPVGQQGIRFQGVLLSFGFLHLSSLCPESSFCLGRTVDGLRSCREVLYAPQSWSFSCPGHGLMLLVSHWSCVDAWDPHVPAGSRDVLVVTRASGKIMKSTAHHVTCVYRAWVLLMLEQISALTPSSRNKRKLQEFIKLSENDNTGSEEFPAQTHFVSWKHSMGMFKTHFFSCIWRKREQARKLRYLSLII